MHRRITLILMISSHASSCGPAPEEERLASEQLAIAQRLQVSEDVQAVFTRAYQWNISKTGPEEITVEIGQTKSVPYAVAVRVADPVDRGWSVRGHIGIDNFTKRAAVIKRVTDSVDGLIDATVACGQDYPIRLAAGTGLECIYSADLPDATFSSNTSCAETRGRIAGACATVPIDFSAPTMETVDDCVNVTDDRHGPLGFACARTGPLATWDYEVVVGPYDRCGTYEVPNTACFETFNSFTSAFNFPRRECQTSILEVDVPCGVCGPHGRNLRRFEVTLAPLNDSFASGTAELILCGDQLTVQFRGHNLEPGRHAPHQLHIQGLDSRRNATCPPPEAAVLQFLQVMQLQF